ncbi:hypothetical protein COU91_02570 [Candidatus Saccharibacteria bacterium CG10_big_fil_rev_8_21_14_0_10_47_8]|nr:MAG: hypothetical protein COU91_02570 [Candidatus Saccharibacteria bacterium CG10_big_fil_rev_8_21_14_0_10_47_8]
MTPRESVTPYSSGNSNRRVQIWYGVLMIVIAVFVVRLFYLQIIKHDYYHQQALKDQLKEYSIAAERGVIMAHDRGGVVPIVLNEKLYTLYADPTFVKNPDSDAISLAKITNSQAGNYAKLMKTKNSRYVVLAKRVTPDQKNKIMTLKLSGVGVRAQDYRTYPQGSLAAQLLGFVSDDGKGTYGLEQALNKELTGTSGMLKAITDASGVPLVANRDNLQVAPKDGSDVTLTVDVAIQKQLETILKQGLDKAKSSSGSAVILDPNNGAIKAMANWPTYDPSQYYKVADANLFNNAAVSSPLEIGSAMKVLTAAAALDQGVIKPDTSYSDPGHWLLDGHEITNIEEDGGPGIHSVPEILNLSINTGATWMLMQMGGQTGTVTKTARDKWHDYMVNHYQLGKATGVEQGYESSGTIPDPDNGYALQLTYANTAFGQAMTTTPLQLAAALASVVNGGTYYQPHLVDSYMDSTGKTIAKKPVIIRQGVVSTVVSQQMQSLMEYVLANHHLQPPFTDNYSVGGKTGTAQIANPAGGYYSDKYNGTYLGFVGGDKPQYVIMVRVNQPGVGGYAGTAAAQPIFSTLAHMLIDNFGVVPKS